MISFLTELRKELPPLSAPGLGLPRSPLIPALDRLTHLFGTAAADPQLREDIFALVKAAFQKGPDGVTALPLGRLAYAPYALLYGERIGRTDDTIVAAYLKRLEGVGVRAAARRVWTHYLLSLEPDDAATHRIAAWLKAHMNELPDRLRAFTVKYNVLDPTDGPRRMAIAALEGDVFIADVVTLGITLERLRTSALIVSVLGFIGKLLREGADPPDPLLKILALLGGTAEDVFERAQARAGLRQRAVGSLVGGLVAWQRQIDPGDAKPEPVVDLLLAVNGDPRFSEGRWKDVVDRSSTTIVEGWLTRKTIEAFFRVISALNVERGDMWKERREFWLDYLPFIRRSWLIVGARAVPLADREGLRYGTFSRGVSGEHCGLVLEIDDLSILEMNVTGRAILWKTNAVQPGIFPEIYDDRSLFDRFKLTAYVDRDETWKSGCIGLAHHTGWQGKFRSQIQQNTGHGVVPTRQFRNR
jgi:hypothetical protein